MESLHEDVEMQTPLLVAGVEPEKVVSENSSKSAESILRACLGSFMILQFGLACHFKNGAQINVMVYNLVLLMVSVCLYDKTSQESNIKSTAILLLHNVMSNIIVALILFNHANLALLVLVVSILFLLAFVSSTPAKSQPQHNKSDSDSLTETTCSVY
mmetsp:Transcript_3541/g.7094  ORF Transcript_3541/g.7094 Transcript_3541/m.7094 type:complete len:158 (+) Transcript_3541:209-682(+)